MGRTSGVVQSDVKDTVLGDYYGTSNHNRLSKDMLLAVECVMSCTIG